MRDERQPRRRRRFWRIVLAVLCELFRGCALAGWGGAVMPADISLFLGPEPIHPDDIKQLSAAAEAEAQTGWYVTSHGPELVRNAPRQRKARHD